MVNVRIVQRPTGLINGREWPAVGGMIDLPEASARDMASAGQVTIVEDAPEVEETATPNLDQVETATPPKRKRGRPRKIVPSYDE